MSRSVDLGRLRATLGSPELTRLVEALQKRIELGRALTGSLTLSAASEMERLAIDAFLGRKSTRGASLQVDLDFLAVTLSAAGICDNLETAVEALRGVVIDRRALAEQRASVWSALWRSAAEEFASLPVLQPWLARLAGLGLLRRLCDNDPEQAAALILEIAHISRSLPAAGEPLASFAARLFGDAHALDPGSPRATLAVRAAARVGEVSFKDDAEGRRAAWASVGVMCDELSTPVLVFNLVGTNETPLTRLLRSACADAEPVHVSLRLLLRWPLTSDPAMNGRQIFICENPTIVALAAARFGRKCAPLICVNGQFATPSLVLLRQLRAAGAQLCYHGDFDPAGLAIARRAMAESGARPWRFCATDYASAPKGVTFSGSPGPTPWDETLREAMRVGGRTVHEEAVFSALAEDLAG